jgi:hypothetical protein
MGDSARAWQSRIVNPLLLEETCIRILFGRNGTEPSCLEKRYAIAEEKGWVRYAICISNYYPSLCGGYYQNTAMIRAIQSCLRDTGFHIVLEYLLDLGSALPDELLGTLPLGCECIVFLHRHEDVVGKILLWELDTGGGKEPYRDAIVLDWVLSMSAATEMLRAVQQCCKDHDVAIDNVLL